MHMILCTRSSDYTRNIYIIVSIMAIIQRLRPRKAHRNRLPYTQHEHETYIKIAASQTPTRLVAQGNQPIPQSRLIYTVPANAIVRRRQKAKLSPMYWRTYRTPGVVCQHSRMGSPSEPQKVMACRSIRSFDPSISPMVNWCSHRARNSIANCEHIKHFIVAH
jgi:hypothetical protein